MTTPPRLMIATPCHRNAVHIGFCRSLLQTQAECAANGEVVGHATVATTHLAHGRNSLVAMALAGGASHLLFIDDDIEWPPEAPRRMIGYGLDVLGGIYADRRAPERVSLAGTCPAPDVPAPLLESAHVFTGFMMLSRAAMERMTKAFPEGQFRFGEGAGNASPGPTAPDEGTVWCQRWRGLGGRMFCDPSIRLVHYGERGYVVPWHEPNTGNH